MKLLSKIFLTILLFIPFFSLNQADASISGLLNRDGNIEGLNSLTTTDNKGLIKDVAGKDLKTNANTLGLKIINYARWVFSAILVIFIVYAGIQMITSMGTDDDSLSKAKRSLWYAIIGLIFVNFPIEIYYAIVNEGSGDKGNLFVYYDRFRILLSNVLTAIEILLGAVAVFVLVLEGIKLIANSKDSEAFTKAKKRIQWTLIGLVFLGFVQLWVMFLRDGNIESGSQNIFKPVANLFLYLAGPIALFFLTLAGYYLIFSNGDEDKVKKGKNIVINTCIGIIIIICVYVLLNDISLLNF